MVVFGQRLALIIFEVFSSFMDSMVLWSHENIPTHSQPKGVCWFGAAKNHLYSPDWGLTWVIVAPFVPPSLPTDPQQAPTAPWSRTTLVSGPPHKRFWVILANRRKTKPYQTVGHGLCRLGGKSRGMIPSPGPDPATSEALSLLHWNPVPYFYGKSLWSCLQDWGEMATLGLSCKDDARSWIDIK